MIILDKELNFRKLSWKYVGCSLYELHDLLIAVYERGKEDERKRIKNETKTESNVIFGEESFD
jgi:hypothetical protein